MKLRVILMLCAFLVGCYNHDRSLLDLEKLQATIVHSDKIKISDFTNFKWDKMYAIAPYTPERLVTSKFNRPINSDWMHNEGICLLVFCLNGNVVAHQDFSRKVADFIGLGREDGVSYGEECKVVKSNGGYGPYVVPSR